jgi:hypothetical protein
MKFTHYWVTDFGWENTIFQPTDFKEVEKLGENKEGIIYLGIAENGKKHILLDDLK